MPICFINAKILKSLNPNKQWTSKYAYLVELCFKLPADYNKDWLIAIQVICTPFQTAVKKIYSHNLFFLTIIESYTYRDMFSPCRKVLDFRFFPVYITVTSGPSVLEWVWPGAKYCRGLWEVAIWFRERNSSFTFRKCTRIISFFIIFFFLRRLVKSTKEDFLLQ